MSFQYKNVSDMEQILQLQGAEPSVVPPGETTVTPVKFHNANFELIGGSDEAANDESAHVPVEAIQPEEPLQATASQQPENQTNSEQAEVIQ